MLVSKAFVAWLFGVPGAGKTAIARRAADEIRPAEVLDSDDIRSRLTPSPSWGSQEREMLYRATWEVAMRLLGNGVSSLIAASGGGVSLDEFQSIAPGQCYFVHVVCDLECALNRRPMGWYDLAQKDQGIRLPIVRVSRDGTQWQKDLEFAAQHGVAGYEIALPQRVDLTLCTDSPTSVHVSARRLLEFLGERGHFKKA